ncbi:MAG: hypothetical protein ACLQNE_29720 [Thermoguttaceae bacterium]
MGEADRDLHFACQKCTARLTAPRRRAGTKGRCPWCQNVFTVPLENRLPFAGEAYTLEDPSRQPTEVRQRESSVAVTCPVCRTRMVASEQQVGEEITCPDCGTKTIVPPLVPVLAKEVPAADIQEGYALRTDPGQPRPESVVGQEYYAVRCPVCATRLHATPDQVGTTMVCPDCRKGFVVPPPPPPKAVRDVEPLQAYDLRPPVERTYELGPAAEKEERGAGSKEQGAGSREKRAGDKGRGAGGREQVSEEGPPRPEKKSGEKRRRRTIRKRSARPTLPAHPFLSGVLSFPFYPNVWVCWLSWTCIASCVAYLLTVAVQLASAGSPVSLFFAMVIGIGAGVFGLLLFAAASAYLLAILQESAEGADRIENWPETALLDWIFQCLNIVIAMSLALMAGTVVDRLLDHTGRHLVPGAVLGLLGVFPIALLSVLESGSPFLPISMPVLHSLRYAWRGWAVFYFQTVILVPGAIAASVFALVRGGLWAIVPAATLLVATCLIYFRLLGRLAWYCAETARRLDAEAEEQSSETA